MSLQRGKDIRGWEGVTRDLSLKDNENNVSSMSLMGLLIAAIVAVVVALTLAPTDIPPVAKALLVIGAFIGVMMLMSGVYSASAHRDNSGDTETASAPAKAAAPKPAAKAAPAPKAAAAPKPAPAPEPDPVVVEAAAPEPAAEIGQRPAALDGPRDGTADDLTLIKGVGPKLAKLCNTLGFYHFDQIAAWTGDEVAWVDENLEGFKGRVTRDDWVSQAKILASGGETEFSARQ